MLAVALRVAWQGHLTGRVDRGLVENGERSIGIGRRLPLTDDANERGPVATEDSHVVGAAARGGREGSQKSRLPGVVERNGAEAREVEIEEAAVGVGRRGTAPQLAPARRDRGPRPGRCPSSRDRSRRRAPPRTRPRQRRSAWGTRRGQSTSRTYRCDRERNHRCAPPERSSIHPAARSSSGGVTVLLLFTHAKNATCPRSSMAGGVTLTLVKVPLASGAACPPCATTVFEPPPLRMIEVGRLPGCAGAPLKTTCPAAFSARCWFSRSASRGAGRRRPSGPSGPAAPGDRATTSPRTMPLGVPGPEGADEALETPTRPLPLMAALVRVVGSKPPKLPLASGAGSPCPARTRCRLPGCALPREPLPSLRNPW